jgi:hypothetical protein
VGAISKGDAIQNIINEFIRVFVCDRAPTPFLSFEFNVNSQSCVSVDPSRFGVRLWMLWGFKTPDVWGKKNEQAHRAEGPRPTFLLPDHLPAFPCYNINKQKII